MIIRWLICSILSASGILYAQKIAAIKDNNNVMIDVGSARGVQSGMTGFIVAEIQKEADAKCAIVARIQITEVGEYYSQGKVSGRVGKIQVGMPILFSSLPDCSGPNALNDSTVPKDTLALFDQASGFLLEGRIGDAFLIYKKLLDKDPSNLLLAHFVKTYQEPVRLIEARRIMRMTMEKIKQVATKLETYYVDENCYAKAGIVTEKLPEDKIVYVTFDENPQSFGFRIPSHELEKMLIPIYVKKISMQDAWGNEMEVLVNTGQCPQQYMVRSSGSNDIFDNSSYLSNSSFKDDTRDIVLSNGMFIEWPAD